MKATVSRGAAIADLAARFQAAGIEAPEREARLVLCAAAGLRMVDLILDPDAPLGPAAEAVEAFAARRAGGEPLSRILGEREFWSLRFKLTPDVLDPRADTETLVDTALAEFETRRGEPIRIVDCGIGSGAILAALLSEFPQASGVGVDKSERAAEVARANLAALGLSGRASVRVGDWGQGLDGPFDLIVSNPPYIASRDIDELSREVREHDPRLALDGGADGLEPYRALSAEIARLLAPGGLYLLEHGEGQGEAIAEILAAAGLEPTIAREDLGGIARVIGGRRELTPPPAAPRPAPVCK